jgi:hypothetical protein
MRIFVPYECHHLSPGCGNLLAVFRPALLILPRPAHPLAVTGFDLRALPDYGA